MANSKANLQKFTHSLESPWVSFVPTVLRLLRSICVGLFPLEKSPGGYCSQATLRVRFPKPPWNFLSTTILSVIDYFTASGDTIRTPLTIHHVFDFTGIALNHVPAGVRDASDTMLLLDNFTQSDQSSPDETYVSDPSVSNRRPEKLRNLTRLIRREITCVSFLPSPIDGHSFLTGTCLFQSHLHFSNLRNGDPVRIWDLGVNDGDSVVRLMELWLFKFRFCWSAMARLHLVLVEHWQPYLSDFVPICWLENILAMFRRTSIDKRGSNVWKAMETFFVFMLKGITESTFLRKTLVRKCWCHYVYLSELALDTSALMLRFVKRSHSYKLLFTIRNKEKSNMKLDNNRFFDRLASKATLRKASSNSLLLYFLLVYGTYICVFNNCASIILYDFCNNFFE